MTESSPHPEQVPVDLLDRWTSGTATPDDRARIAAYVARVPAAETLFQTLAHEESVAWPRGAELRVRLLRLAQDESVECRDAATVTDDAAARIARRHRAARSIRRAEQGTLRRVLAYVLPTGGALVIAVAVYLGMRIPHGHGVPARTYATRAGERATIRLDDGTTATLAPQTSMTVGAGYGVTHRDVRLTGQAYFDVAPTASNPLVVHAGAVTTRVLGTAFMVRYYASDREVVVAVRSGKVVTGNKAAVTLTKNMVARLTDSTVRVVVDTDLREYIEWTQGRLVFAKVRAAEVVTVLGQWYGLTFRFADSTLQDQPLTGAFDDRDSKQDVLQNLELLLGVQMRFDGNVVTLVPQQQAKTPKTRMAPIETGTMHTEVGR
jgi:ferric-dicitrate binding protein FerR (iron transport regulator)